jgi:hypothetical protein
MIYKISNQINKMKKTVFAGLFLISGFIAAQAQVKLSFNPEKGKKYEYRTDITQNITQSVMGQTIPVETEMNFVYLMEITGKTPQETTVQFTFLEIAYMVSSPMMKMGYDSKNPVENPSDTDKIFDKMFGKLIGESFTAVIAPDGSVKSIAGMDAIAESMINAISGEGQLAAQLGAQMKSQFGDELFKKSIEQSLKIYPANAVKVGESWNMENIMPMNGMNTAFKTKYTLKSVSRNMAVIAVESEIEMDPSSVIMGVSLEGNLSGTQTGTMTVDVKTGLPATSDLSQDIKGTFRAQGMEIQMEVTAKTKNTIK